MVRLEALHLARHVSCRSVLHQCTHLVSLVDASPGAGLVVDDEVRAVANDVGMKERKRQATCFIATLILFVLQTRTGVSGCVCVCVCVCVT